MDYAEQLLKGVDYVIAARLQEHKFDETIICTVVDDTKASEGLYVVSDGTIKFDAYSESVDYKVDQAVRVNIPKGDYSQKKYIVGKAVSEKNGNQPIVYRAPSAQILDLTDNVFSQGSGRSWSIYANGGTREKLIQSINLRDQYGGLIYDTLYLKAKFKTIFNQYAMCSGGYGIYIIATMASKDSSGKQNQRIYYFDSKHMFGNPYNYLISSSQETKFFIGKDESITNIAIYLYQDNGFKYKDSKGTIQTYPKSPLAEDIIVSDIYISLGVDLAQVEDNRVEIQTTESLNYNDPQTDVDNTKIIRVQWYNKDENNQYIGFSDGVVPTPQNRKFLFIGDSYGVGQNSETWHGWPYYTALSLGFDKPEYGGMYYSATDEQGKPGAARYVNTNPNWDQWIAIAQQNVGFVGKSTYVPVDNGWIDHDSGKDYNFAKIAKKAADFLRTASYNSAGNNKLPPLPDDANGQYTPEIKEQITDIVIAGGWSDRGKGKSQIAAGIINFIREAVDVTRNIQADDKTTEENEDSDESSVQRIYIIGSDFCGSEYPNSSQAKEDLKNVYSYYKSIIDDLNNGNEIEYYRGNDDEVKQPFTTKVDSQLKIIYADGKTKNCPELIFYDIHEILSDDDFKNDKSVNEPVRGTDDNVHPAASGYQKIGKEIARRVRLIESELDYAKRLSEHNRIVAQMKKDGVPDDYAGFELNARYEEIKDLKTTLINLINIDLYSEIKDFQYALNGKAKDQFTNWLNQLKGVDGSSGIVNNIILAFNGSQQELGLLDFYKNGLDFAKKVQDGLVIVGDNGKYEVKKENGDLDDITKPFGLRKIENKLLGQLSNNDKYAYIESENYLEQPPSPEIPNGYLIDVINGIGNHMAEIKAVIKNDTNLRNIYNGYETRINKIKNTIIKEKDRFKALSLGHLYSINSRLDNSDETGSPVNYYTSWYLFEDPLHPKQINLKDEDGNLDPKSGQGLLTSRILVNDSTKQVSLFPKRYYPDKFDKQSNLYSIYWYYYRDGYKAGEGENHLGGDNWCEITDPGKVKGKPRFNVINTNDNIGLPEPILNEITGKQEYPKKPEVDDENGYLTISFSKERPDVKEEKIKAVLIYDHEKYESNVLTFENRDPAAGPELANNIQIVHGSNSQAVYPLYGVDNTLIKASDENTKRQLKVQYLNERGEPESGNDGTVLKGASIYWYVPTQATMLRTEDIDLVNASGNEENFTKGSMVEWDFDVVPTMATENGKDQYVDSCKLIYTTERPVFKKDNDYFYIYQGTEKNSTWGKLTDGGVVTVTKDNNIPVKVTITYEYNYNRNDEYRKFYIYTYNGTQNGTNNADNWNIVTPLSYGGITYSISEDGNYIINSNNDKYYIGSDNKITLEVDTPDENDQKGYDYYYKRIEDVDDLIFTYRIKNYYSSGSTNNTIKCKVVKGNQTLESSINLDFNSHGSNGTNYSLVVKPLPLTTKDIYYDNETGLIVNKRAFEVMLFDYENKQIPFKQTPTVSLLGGGNKPQISLEPKTSNETGVLTYITNDIEIPHYNYNPWFLKVEANQPWPLDSNELVTLETQYPIPLSNSTESTSGPYQGDIPTTIVYDSFGGTPSYYKSPLALYDKNGELIQNCKWSILYFEHQKNANGTVINTTRVKPPEGVDENSDDYKTYLRKINFLPKLQGEANGVAKLVPSTMYVDDDHKICAVLKCGTADNNNYMRWLQPLLICQNRYPSAMLNNWDGGLSIDEDNNRILANIVGAGKKENDNSFSGVLMGEVENADVPTGTIRNVLQHPHTGLGLYGFHQGEQSFGFNVNGTAFIGKSGSGRIAFDGTHGFIYSQNWLTSDHILKNGQETDQPFSKDAETGVITLNQGTSGMAIDLQNGHIDAYDFKLTSDGIQLNSKPDQNNNEDYLYIGKKTSNGGDPDQFIKYSANGDLVIRVNSLALTGTIGGVNLLNNTVPRENLPLVAEYSGSPRSASRAMPMLAYWTLVNKNEPAHQDSQEYLKIGEWNDKRWILLGGYELDSGDNLTYHRQMWNSIGSDSNFEKGIYTLSGFVYCHQHRNITFRLGSYEAGKGVAKTLSLEAGILTPIHLTFNLSDEENDIAKIFHIYESFKSNDFSTDDEGNKLISSTWYQGLKLEKSDYATAWSRSEQDIEDDKINRKNLLFNTGPVEAEGLKINSYKICNIHHWKTYNPASTLGVLRGSSRKKWIRLAGATAKTNNQNQVVHYYRQMHQYLDGSLTQNNPYEKYLSQGFYTLSGTVFCSEPRTITFRLGYFSDDAKGINPLATLELDGTETEFSYIFQVKENNQVQSIFHIYDASTSNSEDNPTFFHHLKLEKGLWATPWDQDSEDDGLSQYLVQRKIFNSLTANGTIEGIWMEDKDQDGATNLYINASYINSGILTAEKNGVTVFSADVNTGLVNVAGWVADGVWKATSLTDRKFLFIGDSYGVGSQHDPGSPWAGWPYFLAEQLGFNKAFKGGYYPSSSGGATRYVNADKYWSQWIAIAQSGTGFARPSTYSPPLDKSWVNNDPGTDYTFATLMNKSQDILRTAFLNKTNTNELPKVPESPNDTPYTDQIASVTDIVVAGGWNDMWYDKASDVVNPNIEDITLGIINFIRSAVLRCDDLKRIYVFGISSCDDNYETGNDEEGNKVTANDARRVLLKTYQHYAKVISQLNNCENIRYGSGEDQTKIFTRKTDDGQLQILKDSTSSPGDDASWKNCPDLVFYDIHDILRPALGTHFMGDNFHPTDEGNKVIATSIKGILTQSHSRLYNNPGGFTASTKGFYLSNIPSDYWAIQIGEKNTDFSSVGGSSTELYRPFMVSQDGTLWASGAHIKGNIVATSGNISGWSISANGIAKSVVADNATTQNGVKVPYWYVAVNAPSTYSAANNGNSTFLMVQHVKRDGSDEDTANDVEYPFYVRHNGKLVATNADIKGKITATSGSFQNVTIDSGCSIAGWTVNENSLTKGVAGQNDSICLYTSYPTSEEYWRLLIGSKFKVDKNGNITANGGNIGSWSITKVEGSGFTGLYSNQMSESSGYQIYLTPKGISHKGYASAGSNTNWTSISWGNIIAALASYTESGLW